MTKLRPETAAVTLNRQHNKAKGMTKAQEQWTAQRQWTALTTTIGKSQWFLTSAFAPTCVTVAGNRSIT